MRDSEIQRKVNGRLDCLYLFIKALEVRVEVK
jgi:hypothetical protein